MRKLLIAGNWKMNVGAPESQYLLQGIMERRNTAPKNADVLVCPPSVSLAVADKVLEDSYIKLGAQNVSSEDNGAYTGEISTQMLKEVRCTYVIVGHSERREYFDETDAVVNKKVKKALSDGLKPIVCVGETLEQRQNDEHKTVVKRQVDSALEGVEAEVVQQVVFAYEPIWAIGTGETATPEQAEEMHAMIRENIATSYDKETAEGSQILYGGSMKPSNARDLLEKSNIDGGLIGGASLRARSFDEIIEVAANLD